ncbi:hypothetical protein B0H63DRAFT_307674 [Podospora didyma]|uniref:Branchpoint-bridging protein n=1 Tax=Podospora didyma TaxID=330526 RepID=A0AAE0N4N4_9PEZI|nr:hypothetical protein B0H63DRAFT_307674 [Podospora didyma]
MESESGAKIAIRGKGSVKEGKGRSDAAHSSNQEEDLHCLIMADTEEKVNKAKKLIHNIIETAASIPEVANMTAPRNRTTQPTSSAASAVTRAIWPVIARIGRKVLAGVMMAQGLPALLVVLGKAPAVAAMLSTASTSNSWKNLVAQLPLLVSKLALERLTATATATATAMLIAMGILSRGSVAQLVPPPLGAAGTMIGMMDPLLDLPAGRLVVLPHGLGTANVIVLPAERIPEMEVTRTTVLPVETATAEAPRHRALLLLGIKPLRRLLVHSLFTVATQLMEVMALLRAWVDHHLDCRLRLRVLLRDSLLAGLMHLSRSTLRPCRRRLLPLHPERHHLRRRLWICRRRPLPLPVTR